ncbi:MAG: hypothetical protein LBP22_13650 [Deltaproteobacteria bacterium]|jgi:YegS/Rv2252/BmrU family lipid kinase|nr:hypothetical protein [Deltaproteobacteria bacterium]
MESPAQKNHLFIINPKSFDSSGQMESFISATRQIFDRKGLPRPFFQISKFPRESIASVRQFKNLNPSAPTRVYAVGGDGILFDCLNGIVDLDGVELASVPYGKSNDFIRAFGEKKMDFFRDIGLQATSPVIKTDIMKCGSIYGLNTCTLGLEAYAIHSSASLNESMKGLKAHLPVHIRNVLYDFNFFLGGALSATNGLVNTQYYQVSMDGKDFSGHYCTINVGNGPCYGGNKMAAVHAEPDDGLLDVILFKSLSVIRTIRIAMEYVKGKYYKFPDYLTYYRAKEITVSSEVPIVIQVDGEVFVDTSFTVKVMAGAVNFVSPGGLPYHLRLEYCGVPYEPEKLNSSDITPADNFDTNKSP